MRISLVDNGFHSYIPLKVFSATSTTDPDTKAMSSLCSLSSGAVFARPWADLKNIIDKVHRHVCGHASFSDIKTLLTRNSIWDATVENYLGRVIEACSNCRATALPAQARKVSLSSLNAHFNQIVYIDHFFLDNYCIFHAMDKWSRYSTGHIVPNTTLRSAITALEACWFSQFWYPTSVHGDKAFHHEEFTRFIKLYDISFRPVPPRRHKKTP